MQKHQTRGTRQTTSWKQWQMGISLWDFSQNKQWQHSTGHADAIIYRFLQLLVEQTDLYYQGHFTKQARPSCLIDITLLTMTSLALALQMENDLRDELWDYSSRLEHFYIPLTPQHVIPSCIYCKFCILQTIQKELTKIMSMTNHGNYGWFQCTEPGLRYIL